MYQSIKSFQLKGRFKAMTKKSITIKRIKNGHEKIVILTRIVYLHIDILEAYYNKALAKDILLDFDSLCDLVIRKG